jgi:Protein of unknown function (DUF3037)
VRALSSFNYAVLRVVPRVDREEFLNAGVILFCLEQRFLGALIDVDEKRIHALWPDLDANVVRLHLEAFVKIGHGDLDVGPIAHLSQRERFQWLVAPRSTIIQVSPVHSGLCESPELRMKQLFQQLVAV